MYIIQSHERYFYENVTYYVYYQSCGIDAVNRMHSGRRPHILPVSIGIGCLHSNYGYYSRRNAIHRHRKSHSYLYGNSESHDNVAC